jgi:hypothetical protein
MTRILLFLPPMLLLVAAGPSYAAAQHDVPWYMANSDALQSELTACETDPGDISSTPDCVNADAAQKAIDLSFL